MKESRGLMGLPPPPMGYEGMVQVGPQRVQVTDGVMHIQGKSLNVSETGEVMDDNGQQIAKVVNGQLQPMQQQQQPQQAQQQPQMAG